jgi:hypothetical protein
MKNFKPLILCITTLFFNNYAIADENELKNTATFIVNNFVKEEKALGFFNENPIIEVKILEDKIRKDSSFTINKNSIGEDIEEDLGRTHTLSNNKACKILITLNKELYDSILLIPIFLILLGKI